MMPSEFHPISEDYPRVSIITIFLNEERFLAEAIESVLAQTYTGWELLLCDDGSTDSSAEIAKSYVDRYPDRIRYLEHPRHENRGKSVTRNLGLANARGEYIGFLDGDDVWLPEKLERQVACLDAHPEVAMVYGPSVWWNSWASGDFKDDKRTYLSAEPAGVIAGELILKQILQHKSEPLFTCSVLVRTSSCIKVGGFEDQFLNLDEDRVFFSKILLTYNVLVVSEPYDLYRQHSDSTCALARQQGGKWSMPILAARLDYLRWLRDYAAYHGSDRQLRWLVKREYWIHRFPPIARVVMTSRFGVRSAFNRARRLAFTAGRRVLPRGVRTRAWDLVTRASLRA